MTTTVKYTGAHAKKNPDGSFTRASGYSLFDTIVDPGAPIPNGGDPQFTSVVNGKIDLCVFQNWLDAYYDNPTAPGAINHHVECWQLGGCQGFLITRTAFVNGETHSAFARAWPKSASVPGQTIQGLVFDGCFFGMTRHGFNGCDFMDDLADLTLGPTDMKIINCVLQQGPSVRLTHHDRAGAGVEIAHNVIAGATMYGLGIWKALGYNVHDNVYKALNGVSPFPGDRVDPNVDLSYATWAANVGHPVVTPPPPPPPPVPVPPPTPEPVPVPTPGGDVAAQLAAALARINAAKLALG